MFVAPSAGANTPEAARLWHAHRRWERVIIAPVRTVALTFFLVLSVSSSNLHEQSVPKLHRLRAGKADARLAQVTTEYAHLARPVGPVTESDLALIANNDYHGAISPCVVVKYMGARQDPQ